MPTITCCNKEFNIPYIPHVDDKEYNGSLYIKDLVELNNDNVDIIIPIPDKYCNVVDNYVEYTKNNKVSITSRERLFLCFQLNALFIDESYFKYLIQQTFNNWSYMCVMVYNEFNDDLQWSFFVHSPIDFIPKYLLDSDPFMKRWNKVNQNIITNVNNGNEVYYSNVKTVDTYNNYEIIRTYHTVKYKSNNDYAKEVGYVRVITYNPDTKNIVREDSFIDHEPDGLWRSWYDNDKHALKSEECYIDGKKDGVWRYWYDNDQHTLKSEGHYVNGEIDGVWREWYDNDQQTTGILREPWLRHTLKSEQHYVNDEKDGLWRYWYDNDQHTLEAEGHYVDGKLDGVRRSWYDNDQHTLKSEGYYVNDEKDGRWINFDVNGNIISDDEYVYGDKQ